MSAFAYGGGNPSTLLDPTGLKETTGGEDEGGKCTDVTNCGDDEDSESEPASDDETKPQPTGEEKPTPVPAPVPAPEPKPGPGAVPGAGGVVPVPIPVPNPQKEKCPRCGEGPSVPYPGGNTKLPPGPGWTWDGKKWVSPGGQETLRPDLGHAPPQGPHWDWKKKGIGGHWWWPGKIEPKGRHAR